MEMNSKIIEVSDEGKLSNLEDRMLKSLERYPPETKDGLALLIKTQNDNQLPASVNIDKGGWEVIPSLENFMKSVVKLEPPKERVITVSAVQNVKEGQDLLWKEYVITLKEIKRGGQTKIIVNDGMYIHGVKDDPSTTQRETYDGPNALQLFNGVNEVFEYIKPT